MKTSHFTAVLRAITVGAIATMIVPVPEMTATGLASAFAMRRDKKNRQSAPAGQKLGDWRFIGTRPAEREVSWLWAHKLNSLIQTLDRVKALPMGVKKQIVTKAQRSVHDMSVKYEPHDWLLQIGSDFHVLGKNSDGTFDLSEDPTGLHRARSSYKKELTRTDSELVWLPTPHKVDGRTRIIAGEIKDFLEQVSGLAPKMKDQIEKQLIHYMRPAQSGVAINDPYLLGKNRSMLEDELKTEFGDFYRPSNIQILFPGGAPADFNFRRVRIGPLYYLFER